MSKLFYIGMAVLIFAAGCDIALLTEWQNERAAWTRNYMRRLDEIDSLQAQNRALNNKLGWYMMRGCPVKKGGRHGR